MTKQEIETITNALIEKQTWVRKGLSDFLDIWSEITNDKIYNSKFQRLKIFSHEIDLTNNIYREYYLERGYSNIYFIYEDDWAYDNFSNEETMDIDDVDISLVKKAIDGINKALYGYFKALQTEIDEHTEAGKNIMAIVKKLS